MEELAIYVSPGRTKPAGFGFAGVADDSDSETIND